MSGEGLIGLGTALAGASHGYETGLDEQRQYDLQRQQMGIQRDLANVHLGTYQMQKTRFDEEQAIKTAGDQFWSELGSTMEDQGRFAPDAAGAIKRMKDNAAASPKQAGGAAPVGGGAPGQVGIMTNGKEPKGFSSLDSNAMEAQAGAYLGRYSEMRDRLTNYMTKLKEANPELALRTRMSPAYQNYVNRMGGLVQTHDDLMATASIVAHSKAIKGYLRAVQTGDAESQAVYRDALEKRFGESFPTVIGFDNDNYIVQPFYTKEVEEKDPVSGAMVKRPKSVPIEGTIKIPRETLDKLDPEIDSQKAFEVIQDYRGKIKSAEISAGATTNSARLAAESYSYDNAQDLHLKASQGGHAINPSDEGVIYGQAYVELNKKKDAYIQNMMPKAGMGTMPATPQEMQDARNAAEASWEKTAKPQAVNEIAKEWGFKQTNTGQGFDGWTVRNRSNNVGSLVDRAHEILTKSHRSEKGGASVRTSTPVSSPGGAGILDVPR